MTLQKVMHNRAIGFIKVSKVARQMYITSRDIIMEVTAGHLCSIPYVGRKSHLPSVGVAYREKFWKKDHSGSGKGEAIPGWRGWGVSPKKAVIY